MKSHHFIQKFCHGREADQNQNKTNHHGDDEADDLVARHRRSHATDGQIGARQEKTADVARQNHTVIRAAQIIHSDGNGKCQHQGQSQEKPRGEEFSHDGLPWRDGHRKQKFHCALSSFFGPKPHSGSGNKEQVQPRMPCEKRTQRRLPLFKEPTQHEREKAGEQQEDDDEHKRDWRREVTNQFALGDCFYVGPGIHLVSSFTVSGMVMLRNTSSKRPSSVCNSSMRQPCAMSPMLWASAPLCALLTPPLFGKTRAVTLVDSSFKIMVFFTVDNCESFCVSAEAVTPLTRNVTAPAHSDFW